MADDTKNEDTGEALPVPDEDLELLKEIQDTKVEFEQAWADHFEQCDKDERAQSLIGPWDQRDIDERNNPLNPRPTVHEDLGQQNIDQVMGQARMNPVGIEATPRDGDADDKTAENVENRIREMNTDSDAVAARLSALEDTIRKGHGAWKVITRYKPLSFKKELATIPIKDPRHTLLMDPYCKQADWSDAKRTLEFAEFSHQEFKQRYPRAQIKSFSPDMMAKSKGWVNNTRVLVAVYSKVKQQPVTCYLLDDGSDEGLETNEPEIKKAGGTIDKENVVLNGQTLPILQTRDDFQPYVCMYETNGVEILKNARGEKETRWEGSTIPIIFITGNERWENGKRCLDSLLCRGRDIQMKFDHACAAEIEEVGKIPLTPWLVPKGGVVNPNTWATMHKIPRSHEEYNEYDEYGRPISPPQRADSSPQIEAINMMKQAAMQEFQNAIGMTSAERRDRVAKSGKALDQLEEMADVGTYHFRDSYQRGIVREGNIYEEMLGKVENTPRKVALQARDGKRTTVTLGKDKYTDAKGQQQVYDFTKGRHSVTISTAPSHESQRKKAEDAAGKLLETPEAAAVWPLAIKLQRLGPVGEQMFDVLLATLPPQVQAAYRKDKPMSPDALAIQTQAEQQQQQLQAVIEELKKEVADLQFKLQAQTVKSEENLKTTQLKIDADAQKSDRQNITTLEKTDRDNDTRYAIAELQKSIQLILAHIQRQQGFDNQAHERHLTERQFEHQDQQTDKQLEAAERSQAIEIANRPEPATE